jgi:pentachlorophenol monooxygenase/3-(3-hydroxy-phenyl)propionate hydroxylase
VLTTGIDVAAALAAGELVTARVRVVELVSLDPTGALATALHAQPGEVWVIRPDAHVAAVVEDPAHIADALLRAPAIERNHHGALPAIR